MINFSSIDEVLDFAIKVEKQEAEFYRECAEKTNIAGMKEVFLGFASEEISHMEKLNSLKKEVSFPVAETKFSKFKITIKKNEDVIDENAFADFDYSRILKYAVKNESTAFNLYSQLADHSKDKQIKGLLQELAREELSHKIKFEEEFHKNFG